MNMISTMSLAGTISLAVYYLAKLVFRDKYSEHGKMILLKISIFFYLCPFQFIKYFFPEDAIIEILPDFYRIHIEDAFYFGQTDYFTLHNISGEYVSYPVWKIVAAFIWLGIVVAFVSYEVVQYFRMRRLVVACSTEMELEKRISPTGQELIREKEKYKVSLLSSSVVDSPFTIGVIKPVIFIPEVEMEADETEMICQHEMTHIKNHDILTKFLCLIIILLHWFNPFSYLVLHEFNILSEYCCDESIMSMRSKEERKKYARLLIHFATEHNPSSKTFWTKSFFESSEKILERRVGVILEMKKKKSWVILLMAVMAVVFSAATVYAYEAEMAVQVTDDFVTATDGVVTFTSEEEFMPDFSVSDDILVMNDGSINYLSEENLVEPRVLCIHAYKDAYYYAHKPNSNGGCEVRKYSAQRCSKCGSVVVGDLISSTTYVKCPH